MLIIAHLKVFHPSSNSTWFMISFCCHTLKPIPRVSILAIKLATLSLLLIILLRNFISHWQYNSPTIDSINRKYKSVEIKYFNLVRLNLPAPLWLAIFLRDHLYNVSQLASIGYHLSNISVSLWEFWGFSL